MKLTHSHSFAWLFPCIVLMLMCVGCSNETDSLLSDISGKLRTGASQGDSKAPSILTARDSVAVEAGLSYTIANGRLMIGNAELTVWTDDITPAGECTVALTLDGQTIANGDKVDKEGLLNIEVTDQAGNVANAQMAVSLYTTAVPEVNNIYKEWELMKSKVKTVGRSWYEFYENIGHVHAQKVIEELDRSGWNDRERKMSQIYIFCLGEVPPDEKTDIVYGREEQAYWEPIIGGLYEISYPPNLDESYYSTGSDHCARIIAQVKTRNDKDWIIPGIAQTYRNKIKCFGLGLYVDENVLAEVKAHSERKYIMGCASDDMMSMTRFSEDFPGVKEWIELANTSNALAFPSIGNVNAKYDYLLSYKEPPHERARYGVGSYASMGRHVIAAVGANPTSFDWRDYEHEPSSHSMYPIGFTNEDFKVVRTYPKTSFGLYEFYGIESSGDFASSPASYALVGLAHNILALDPDMSMDEVIDLIHAHPYKIPTTINGEPTADSETFDFIAMIKEVNLPKPVQSLSSVEVTTLPKTDKFPAILYTGQGVECLLDGQWVPVTSEYISTAATFAKVSKAQEFRFNPELWAKQGGSGKAQIKVQLMTADGESIPDVDRVMEVPVIKGDDTGIHSIRM